MTTATAVAADDPRTAVQWRAQGDRLHAAGDARGGASAHLRAVAASARDPAMVAAAAALNSGNLPAAERLLREQLKRHPTDIAAMRMLAELGVRLGQYGDAVALLSRALEIAPGFEPARFAKALVLARLSRLPEAMAETDALLSASPQNVGYLNLRASVLVRLGQYEEARAIYERVLRERPEQPKIWMSYGHVLKTTGRTDAGVEAYRRSLAQCPELGESWWSLANLKTLRFSDDDIAAMEAALRSPKADDEDVLHLHYALGKAFEDAGGYERSFRHYADGAALRRKQIEYDPTLTQQKVARARAVLTQDFFAARRGHGCSAPDPIFIVGLPRAGSTLVEQILASHGAIEGTMELPDLDKMARRLAAKGGGDGYPEILSELTREECRALGEEYLERTRVQRHTDRPYFIDKMPNNWAHVGLIHLILPNAKIIDARRHPMACCFSAWKQHFARGQSFSYELTEVGRYYVDYVGLMEGMDAAIPGRVHRLIHEQLVENPEAEIKRMLAYLGLPFDANCLEFYRNERAVRTASSEQVRRPISRDGVEQWRNYEPWLEALASAVSPVIGRWNEPQYNVETGKQS